jgi:hypothetical protein
MIPNLLHPVPISVEKIDRASTYYDPDAREPIQQAARATTVVVQGQVNWGTQKGLEPAKAGPREGATGYVLFRRVDLDAAGVTLEDNDRFAKLGDVETDVYVDRLEWEGHYPDQGGPTLVKAYFSDRQPAKQTRGVA